MKRKFSVQSFKDGILLVDKLLIVLLSVATYLVLLALFYRDVFSDVSQLLLLMIIHLGVFSILFVNYGCEKIGTFRLRELLFSYSLTCLITDTLSFLILLMIETKPVYVWHFLVMLAVQIVIGIFGYIIANRIYYKLNPAFKGLAICSDSRWEKDTIRKFRRESASYRVEKVLYENEELDVILGAINDFEMVILGDIEKDKRARVINYCFEKSKRVYILPQTQDLMVNATAATQIGDSLVLMQKSRPMSIEQMLIKRIFDILISSVALVVLSPLLGITALLIKLYDGGPVMFRQARYTRNNEVFTLIKFRSMIVDAEKNGAQFTVPGDKRITPIGKFIRATRIDELPQLINVLKGDMSIIGPRAERTENADAYTEMMPEFRYRTKVKAGLTGYAQVYGKYNTSFEDKLNMDLYYIDNYSLLLDMKLLLYTIKVIFMKESTEGFENETLSEEFDYGKEENNSGTDN